MTEIGGGLYRVSYTLSSGNTRTGGYHRVSYEVHDSTGNDVSAALTLTYVPDGLMDHVIDSGAYSPKPTRTWTVDPQAVTLISVTDTEVDVEPDSLDDEHPDFSTGTTGHTRPGRVFELEIETEGREPKSLFAIVEDPARTGHITVPLSPTSTNCTATECGYTVPLVVGARQPGAGVGQTDLTLSIVTLDGLGTAGDLWVLPGIPIPTSTYLVKGTVKYRPSATKRNCNGTLATEPYACDAVGPAETLPVANMLVRVVTTCPGEHYAWTDEAGDFRLWFDMPTECADEPAMLRVSSVVSPARRVVVFDRAPGQQTQFATKADLVAALPTDGTDYSIYNQYVVVDGAESLTFIPEEDALTSDPLVLNDIMIDDPAAKNAMYLASEGRKVHDYLLPWLGNKLAQFNILVDEQEIVFATDNANANASFFAAHIHDGFVHILPKNKWSNLTVAHEYGHYVHHHFGIDGWQYYGRYSEPMADAQAATIVGESHKAVNSFNPTVNLDFNGHKDENGVSIQPVMHFYASPAAYTDPLPACYDLTDTCCDTFPNDGIKDEAAVIKGCMMVENAGLYAAIFHDLSDGVGNEPEAYGHGNFDQVDGHGASPDPLDHALMDVVLNYMGGGLWPQNPNYSDRGIPHTDVVDVLDGMMCRGHMTQGEADDLLHDVMNFEYDFQPDNPLCQ